MVAIVGYFYFGQDQRLKDEAAVQRAVLNATNWILDHGYRNVLVEVNNECNIAYNHDLLKPPRVPELIALVQQQTRNSRRLLVSTSFGGTTSGGPRDLQTRRSPRRSSSSRISSSFMATGRTIPH